MLRDIATLAWPIYTRSFYLLSYPGSLGHSLLIFPSTAPILSDTPQSPIGWRCTSDFLLQSSRSFDMTSYLVSAQQSRHHRPILWLCGAPCLPHCHVSPSRMFLMMSCTATRTVCHVFIFCRCCWVGQLSRLTRASFLNRISSIINHRSGGPIWFCLYHGR